MGSTTILAKLTVLLFSALAISCGSTRYNAPVSDEVLRRSVLFIQDLPDGRTIHSWRQTKEVDLSQYEPLSRSRGAARNIVLATGRKRDCDEENRECIRECMSRSLPRGLGHITSRGRGLGGKEAYCNDKCMQPYLDCAQLQDLEPQEFTAVDTAVDWVKRHRTLILTGTVVIIAGVAFIVISAGAGLVILAPAVLLATPAIESDSYMAGASP
ncbi:hypothetical protein POL68_25985 [Stigmatella sp. ncwal1]|uniref:Lipoprotein n=1 Tax=Stigmatella ashevillensis TaxID=2995309 RepID=A0ABT5DE39_9BACT|nr:hypothetical protein [Stigmatella ashevillena]MDC0711945.1 hypothetical protein [Stigmatella ashevillena]